MAVMTASGVATPRGVAKPRIRVERSIESSDIWVCGFALNTKERYRLLQEFSFQFR